MSSTFQSLSIYNYRVWFIGAFVANVGTWMQRIAQDWYVLTELTDNSGLAVGIVTALQFAPTVLVTPFAGLLADKVDRRKLLIGTQTAMGILAATLGIFILMDVATLGMLYGYALVLGVVSALDAPARQAFVSELVPGDKLANAVGLNSASFNAARLIGPGISGVLIALIGTGWVFIINAVSFAFTIVAMMVMRTELLVPFKRDTSGEGVFSQIRSGIGYVRRRTDILVIMSVMAVTSALGLNFQLTSAVMAREVFEKDAGEFGLLGSVMAIGSLGGALLAARRKRPRVRLVIGAAGAFGVALGISALAPTYELYALSSVLVGFTSLTMITAANTAIQLSTDPAIRGRVMSLYLIVFMGSTPIGAPIVGWVAETWGARWSIGIGAIASIVVSVLAAWWATNNWGVEVTYRLRGRPHIAVTYLADTGDTGPKQIQEEASEEVAVQQATHRPK